MPYASEIAERVAGKWRRSLGRALARRMAPLSTQTPVITFTFDDCLRTALTTGREIIEAHGARATFFACLGLLGSRTESGEIAEPAEVLDAFVAGHELGCHSFDHQGGWETATSRFMSSVAENGWALDELIPGARFKTFAYPMSQATPSLKRLLANHFICCRGGGQGLNSGAADLNQLKTFFLDARYDVDSAQVKQMIDLNTRCRGWLIFATHDVADLPSAYGCTPRLLTETVEYAVGSGALILPMAEAFRRIWPQAGSAPG